MLFRSIRSGISLANVGYALPGSVLAVSIMLAFSYLDRELVIPVSGWLGGAGKPLLLGSLSALLLAYLEAFRVAQKAVAEKAGVKLTVLPLLLKACAHLLKELPDFNEIGRASCRERV